MRAEREKEKGIISTRGKREQLSLDLPGEESFFSIKKGGEEGGGLKKRKEKILSSRVLEKEGKPLLLHLP